MLDSFMGGGGGYSNSVSSSATAGFGDQSTRSGNFNIAGVSLGQSSGDNTIVMIAVIGAIVWLASKK